MLKNNLTNPIKPFQTTFGVVFRRESVTDRERGTGFHNVARHSPQAMPRFTHAFCSSAKSRSRNTTTLNITNIAL
jgi:hypothetical protein